MENCFPDSLWILRFSGYALQAYQRPGVVPTLDDYHSGGSSRNEGFSPVSTNTIADPGKNILAEGSNFDDEANTPSIKQATQQIRSSPDRL